jgi:hypothetical protein
LLARTVRHSPSLKLPPEQRVLPFHPACALDYFGPDANAPAANDLGAAENGFTADDVDRMLFTQITKRTIAIAAERCGRATGKCHTIMEKYCYTGSACIPMALDDAIDSARSNGVTSSS